MSVIKLVKLDPDNNEQVQAVSSLHSRLLPESSVSRMGHFFMTNFYYKILVRKKLIDTYLIMFDNVHAGFISCTVKPFSFMKEGKNISFVYLVFVILVSTLLNPLRIFLLIKMMREKFPESLKYQLGVNPGQFLSFGVLEAYRKKVDSRGYTLSQTLMNEVFNYFRAKKISSFFLLVKVSNERAINFYKKYNCKILDELVGESRVIKFETEKNV